MKLFLDTNFLADWLFRDEYKTDCERLLKLGELHKYTFAVSFLSLANLAYIARKQPKSLLYSNLINICNMFEVVANNKSHLLKAISVNPRDYEDAIQYAAAVDAGCDCIISRNEKDFEFSEIPVFSTADFLNCNQ